MTHAALIYSHSITPRLTYLVDFLSRYYGLPFKLISDEENYLRSDVSCKINYSYRRITGNEIWIHSHALLFESAIHPVKIECFQHPSNHSAQKGYKVFFKTEGDTGFDLFAAIFYLISRYEEYLPHTKDEFGRYAHQNSLSFRENFLQLPLVNIWLEDFRILLADKNTAFVSPSSSFTFLPTYDIDMAWSFCNKGFKRNTAALLSLFLKGKWVSMSRRIKVLRRKEQDPFDAYQWLNTMHAEKELKPVYFFLVARQKGKYDKNIDVDNNEFQQLIKDAGYSYKIAVHPSWASGDVPSLLVKEKKWLEKLTQHRIDSSRQHFIRFNLPQTYRRLIDAGITNEYSMGYGSINGFRASIASSFYWYDLNKNEATSLLIHPFCFMDANTYYEQKQGAEEALNELMELYQTIRTVHGTMITIWHNSFLGSANEFTGWKETYLRFITAISDSPILSSPPCLQDKLHIE